MTSDLVVVGQLLHIWQFVGGLVPGPGWENRISSIVLCVTGGRY